jgi:eukaryotic-like serine/threonine-protein kinase
MSDEPRVQELLDELLDREATPEEVCCACPELLPAVRERWRQICRARFELDSLFPVWPHGMPPTMAPEELPLPRVPGYEVEAVLGHGGMGVVFRARHLRLGRKVALKMTLAGSYAGPHERERFRREAEAIAALQHANVVQVYDVGDWASRPYFTMELIDGGSLAQRLTGAPQPARQSAALLATLAEAMHAAHQGGIVHRDLKPANILFTPDGTPKVTDFGLARRLEGGAGLTVSGVPLGTPSYMAPEQARGESRAVGPAVDVYALGAILYELLTGRPPFRAETPAETVRQVVDQEPVPPARLNAQVPRDLETVCLKCLRTEPQGRYATAAALADDLRRFGEGRPIRARPLSLATRSWRWGRRNPAAAALMATVLALVGLATGGGFWLEHERGERRAESVRQEEREARAVEGALEQASALGRQGRWPDARAVLKGMPSLFSSSASAKLRERLMQARTDTNVAANLERIRLRLSTDPTKTHSTAAPLYEEAFRSYGIELSRPEPEAAARVGSSAISETLLAYLHDWFYWASDADRTKLRAVLDRADDDHWRRAFRDAVAVRDTEAVRDTGRMAVLAASPDALAQPPLVLSGLGGVLLFDGRREEALALLREAQNRHPEDFWLNYLLGQFWEKASPQVAVGYFRAALAIRPNSDEIYTKLGRALLETRDAEGAIAAFRKALVLNPDVAVVRDLAKALAPHGGLEEARGVWGKILERDPSGHDSWYGYAELCLFLGREDDYRRARRDLLTRFGATTNPFDAERTARACLLLPGTADELRQSAALTERAIAEREGDRWAHPYFQFVHGLARYRQGQFDRAISTIRGDASSVLGPAPRLVLAMALYRSGRAAEARETLAAAVLAHDWRAKQVHADDQNGWIYHVLRREAETLILTTLPAFLQGDWRPQNNIERLTLLGICESEALYGTASRLCADAFAADPDLADRLTTECLRQAAQESNESNRTEALTSDCWYRAARCAALAGGGLGKDGSKLSAAERTHWRRKALEWLRTDLHVLSETLDGGLTADRGLAKELLTLWQDEPDLAGLREPARLKMLSADERKGCLDLWAEVGTVLARCGDAP